MLKIKDHVDLKVLEKYGFVEIHEEHNFYYKLINEYYICCCYLKELVYIIIDLDNNKTIKKLKVQVEPITKTCFQEQLKRCPKRYIKDLIKDGLVEKVKK